MTKSDEPVTASELLSKLNSDPEYRKRLAKRRVEREKIQQVHRSAERPIVEELNAAGFAVDSIWGLLQWPEPYTAAFPILLKHLQLDYPDHILDGLGRAFGVPEAMFVWNDLIELYRRISAKGARDGIAVALSDLAGDEQLDEIIDLVREPKHGESRILLLLVLEKSKEPRAKQVLRDLQNDPDLCIEIAEIRKREERRKRRRRKS